MPWRGALGIIVPSVLESLFVLLTTLLVPLILLLLSWGQPVVGLFSIVPQANSLAKLSEIILIIIPLACLYISTALSFVLRIARTQAISDTLLFTSLFVPILTLLICQPILYFYFITYSHTVLSDNELAAASATIYTSIGCLVMLDVFKSIYSSGVEHRLLRRSRSHTTGKAV